MLHPLAHGFYVAPLVVKSRFASALDYSLKGSRCLSAPKVAAHLGDKMAFYVYQIIDPRDNIPFYVGQTKNMKSREAQHLDLTCRGRKEKITRIKEILDLGLYPVFMAVLRANTREEALKMETYWIRKLAKRGIYVMTGCKEHKAIQRECRNATLEG